jgi:hypothetical protein
MDGSGALAKPGNGDAIPHRLLQAGRMAPASRFGSALIDFLIETVSVIGMQHTTTDQCVRHLTAQTTKNQRTLKKSWTRSS